RGAVAVDELVADGREVAAGIAALDRAAPLGVDGEEVLERPVLVARLADEDLPVLLDEHRGNLTLVAVGEHGEVALAADDLVTSLDHALRTQRIRLPREAEGRVGALTALQQRSRSPVRPRRLRLRNETIDGLECAPPQVPR